MIKRRSFLTYFILSFITLGIYPIVFWYNYADDMNRICNGDGKETKNFLLVLLFSILTCGIYYWIWMYNVGNRLNENAPRYGTSFQENGNTVLLWMIIGIFFVIGRYIAIYILIKNMNELANRYNLMIYNSNPYTHNFYNNQQPPYNF